MLIEIKPRSLLNLQNICEVLYKLHPSVLNDLIEMERSLGEILGTIDLDNASLEEREFLANIAKEVDYSKEPEEKIKELNDNDKESKELKEYIKNMRFYDLKNYIQIDTDEYIPMKIYVEVEDPIIGKKSKRIG